MTDTPTGWPCALLSDDPPSVLDREAAPTADDLLPQILPLTPRGPAWGTDEAGDGKGASPVQRSFWRAIAAWTADHLARDFTAAIQCFPSALTYTLPDWERDLGLPDRCLPGGTADQRKAAVRARFGARGAVSPAWFACLAQSRGYAVTIEEPTQFLVGVSTCAGDPAVETAFACGQHACGLDPLSDRVLTGGTPPGDMLAGSTPDETAFVCGRDACGLDPLSDRPLDNPNGSVWKFWTVRVPKQGPDSFLTCGAGECGRDPISAFGQALDLECLLADRAPPHTQVLFSYA